MHRFSRMHLSADVALRNLGATYKGEKSQLAENIALVGLIDHRRDYLAAGYSCMRSCCMHLLGLSEDQALRRIQVARAAQRFPELFEYLADGRLGVTTAAVLAPHLESKTAAELMAAAARRSKREIEQLVAARSRPAPAPLAPADEPIVETMSCQHAPAHAISLADLCAPAAGPTAEPAPAHAEHSRLGRVTPCMSGGHDVRLHITDEEYEDLRASQALLGHAVPSGDPAVVIARALKHYRAHLEKRRLGVKPGAPVPAGVGRGIPKPLRRLVWERDGGRCTFEGTEGHRCGETRGLELDHIKPLALGGKSSAENLRILCRAHNQFEAERVFGKEHVQLKRELAKRERERDREAAKADAKRAKARDRAAAEASANRENARRPARDAVHQARYDDIYAALRGLDATVAEAKKGAEMADAMPDATTEECLKAALIEMARPVALRGERMARCTA